MQHPKNDVYQMQHFDFYQSHYPKFYQMQPAHCKKGVLNLSSVDPCLEPYLSMSINSFETSVEEDRNGK